MRVYTSNVCKVVCERGIYMHINVLNLKIVWAAILEANGHPTPHHYGKRRGGILHPENSRATYRMLPNHANDTPLYSS